MEGRKKGRKRKDVDLLDLLAVRFDSAFHGALVLGSSSSHGSPSQVFVQGIYLSVRLGVLVRRP